MKFEGSLFWRFFGLQKNESQRATVVKNLSRDSNFWAWGETPPYMSGEPLRLPRQNFGRPRDAKRRHETPRDASRRRDEMPRDAMRRHKTPRDASETPRDAILILICVLFGNFMLILGSPEHHFLMFFCHTSFASLPVVFFPYFQKNAKQLEVLKTLRMCMFLEVRQL